MRVLIRKWLNLTKLVNHARISAILASSTMSQASPDLSVTSAEKRPAEDEETTISKKQKSDAVGENTSLCKERIKRRKYAMMLGYCGQGYLGMQRNPGTKTIEDEVLGSMLKAGLITEENYNIPQSMQFQRAARTDKGVSAIRQVVSLRLGEEEGMKEKINSLLPPQIRVFDLKRTTKGFNSKISCDGRTYSYLCPTFAFAPIESVTTEDFRIDSETVSQIRHALKYFKGTHNFHNFTAGKKPTDASAIRYIVDFQCSEPFIRDKFEFVLFTVRGQSFMLHQIRKMIGLTIAIVRGLTTEETLRKAWQPVRVDIPKAPGLGLVLEEVHYERYNTKFGGDGLHQALLWTEYQNEIQEFKEKFIYSTILEGEKNEKSMMNWLSTLIWHTYGERDDSAPDEPPPSSSLPLTMLGRAALQLPRCVHLLKTGKLPPSHKAENQVDELSKPVSESNGEGSHQTAATATAETSIKLQEASDGQLLAAASNHKDDVTTSDSSEGQLLAAASNHKDDVTTSDSSDCKDIKTTVSVS